MTTEDDLQRLLDENPADWQTRLILADYLGDYPPQCGSCLGSGRVRYGLGHPCLACKSTGKQWDRAAGYRALGELQIVPLMFTSKKTKIWGYHSGFGVDPNTNKVASFRHALPGSWFRLSVPQDVWHLRINRRVLEDEAATTFGRLSSVEQEGIVAAGRSHLRCAAAMGV